MQTVSIYVSILFDIVAIEHLQNRVNWQNDFSPAHPLIYQKHAITQAHEVIIRVESHQSKQSH